jgi:hypothetical protein
MDDPMLADYWRKRAADARQTAERAQDRGIWETMLRMAMTYDRLAGALIERDRRRPALRLVYAG